MHHVNSLSRDLQPITQIIQRKDPTFNKKSHNSSANFLKDMDLMGQQFTKIAINRNPYRGAKATSQPRLWDRKESNNLVQYTGMTTRSKH